MNKRKLFELRLKAKHLLKSLKETNEIHIGDAVRYLEQDFFVNNGVACPYWDIVPLEWGADGKRKSLRIHRHDFKKYFWKNIKRSMLFHYRFYMDNWYAIDLNDLLNGNKPTSETVMGW